MSNNAVGPVYDAVIQEVINAVRVDFEENGIDDRVLEDLKRVRLSISPPSLPLHHCPALPFSISVDQGSHPRIRIGMHRTYQALFCSKFLLFYFPISDWGLSVEVRWRDECRICLGRLPLMTPGREGWRAALSEWATQHFWVSFMSQQSPARFF